MKLIIVIDEAYDCYSAKVAHPIEAESLEALKEEWAKVKEDTFARLDKQYEGSAFKSSYANVPSFHGLSIYLDRNHSEQDPEFYTFEEWFEEYKFPKIGLRYLVPRDKDNLKAGIYVITAIYGNKIALEREDSLGRDHKDGEPYLYELDILRYLERL